MDVMKPELMWFEGRCYRINPLAKSSGDDTYDQEDYQPSYSGYDPDEACDEFNVELTEGGKYKTSFHVARTYFPCIIGVKGSSRKRIENETKTQIIVPKLGQEGDIVIVGQDRRGVCAARRRVNLIVMGSRVKQTFTHFLSVPLNSKTIQESFKRFKWDVLENCRSRGVDATIFQTPEKLHLTFSVMVLADNEERKSAVRLLLDCKTVVFEPLLGNRRLKVRMSGLEYMNDDPTEVDVLYGKVHAVDGSNILQELADNVVDYFANYEGMIENYNNLKLHCTLMNTLFRETKGGENDQEALRGKRKQRESFDASKIMQRFADYDFGEIVIESIHLSQRYTTSESGYYQSTATVNLN